MERIKIGIVGLNFGRSILEQLRAGDAQNYFELAAVCDLNPEKAKEMASRYGVKAYFELGRLLADPAIPAIGLFTGPVGRAELIRQAIRAGKHVMTTKPFELDPAAAREALEEARRLGRAVHLNSPSPLLPPDLATIRDWGDKHDLGRPVGCRADIWASYREKADGSWYDDPEKCPAAPIFRLGIYLINDLVQIFGRAEKVFVLHSRLFTGRPTADNSQLGILFQNGGIASIFASFCVKDGDLYRNTLTLNFENGTIYRNCGPLRKGKPGYAFEMSLVQLVGDSRAIVEQVELARGSGEYQWEAFYRAAQGEQLNEEIAPEQIAAGIAIIQAMAAADRAGGVMTVRDWRTAAEA